MKKILQLFSKQALLLCLILISSMSWGQTTATYDFSASGAVTGFASNPPISVDANIGFASFKNSAGTNPGIFNGQLRLYQNETKGGSIKVYAQNGATISSVVVYASGTTGPAKYSVDGASATSIAFTSGSYAINAINATNEVEFFCVGSSSGTRVYVDKFEVTYTIAPTTIPVVTAATVTGAYNTAVNYQVVASNSPTSYAIFGTLPTGLNMDSATGIISGTPTAIGSFSINVTATNDIGTSAAAIINFEISKANQTLASFTDFTKYDTDAPFVLPSTTEEGLTLEYTSSNTDAATVAGNTVTITGLGTTTITASNAGDANYEVFSQSVTLTITEVPVGPCGLEDFSNATLTASYADGSFTGNNGVIWSYKASRNHDEDANNSGISGNALMLRRIADSSKVSSSTIATGIGDFSVKLYKGFTGGGNRQVELFINGISYGQSTPFNDFSEHIFEVNNINIAGNFTIEIINSTSNQIIVDDITWTCYTSGGPITWNGTSWSNTTGPDATLDAVIDGAYNEAANITAKNLTIASGVVVTVAPTSVLTVSGDLVNNGTLVFQSTAAGTASFAPYTGAAISGTGSVTVERYIPAKRAWRFLTAPLQGTSNNALVANWQGVAEEGALLFAPATYQSQTMTGYAVGGIAPNIFKYNTGWQAIPDLTSENLFGATANDTQAYQIFVTGASNSTNIVTGATATTLRPKGALITGTVNHALTANAYKLLPNPYASPIDTEAMVDNNAGSKVWLLDPSIGLGGYVTYDGLNWSAPTSGNDKNIQSGQGFFVKSTNTSFAIQEALKVTGNSNTWFDRNATASNDTKIRVLLYKQDAADWQLADAILAVNSMNGNTAVDAADASKISNYNESLMFRNATTNLAIEYRALPQVNEIQAMRLTGTSATPYQLRIYVESFIENSLVPLLEDTLLGTFTSIPTDGSTVTIPFTGVVSNTTNPDDRFRMVYQTALSNDSFESLNVVVYPNPVSNGTLSINVPQGEGAAFELYNVLGQKVQQGILAATNNSVDVSGLQSGVYVLNIEQSGKKFTTKVIVDAN